VISSTFALKRPIKVNQMIFIENLEKEGVQDLVTQPRVLD
jgi:hypothetical protein